MGVNQKRDKRSPLIVKEISSFSHLPILNKLFYSFFNLSFSV
jgi:hypothetical protein